MPSSSGLPTRRPRPIRGPARVARPGLVPDEWWRAARAGGAYACPMMPGAKRPLPGSARRGPGPERVRRIASAVTWPDPRRAGQPPTLRFRARAAGRPPPGSALGAKRSGPLTSAPDRPSPRRASGPRVRPAARRRRGPGARTCGQAPQPAPSRSPAERPRIALDAVALRLRAARRGRPPRADPGHRAVRSDRRPPGDKPAAHHHDHPAGGGHGAGRRRDRAAGPAVDATVRQDHVRPPRHRRSAPRDPSGQVPRAPHRPYPRPARHRVVVDDRDGPPPRHHPPPLSRAGPERAGPAPCHKTARPWPHPAWDARRRQNGTSPAPSAGATNRATTFFEPALSKAISSLSPSMPATAP